MKILIVRFSSIGDVVLTTPVVRAIKMQIPNAEVHFITKKAFEIVLSGNSYIDKLFTINKSLDEVIGQLKSEKYDYVIDLHNNIRTLGLKLKLGVKSYTFPKVNLRKMLLVKFKWNTLPDIHIVERYFKPVAALGVKNDNLPCDFFISTENEVNVETEFGLTQKNYVTIAIGAQFATKRIPYSKLIEIIPLIEFPIVLVGGPTDVELAEKILSHFTNKRIFSSCGKYNLAQSASIVKQSSTLLTNDTGMMHIGSCFQIPTVSVWGNTVPEFGMFPYFPVNKELFSIHEVKGLDCRPCSKLGFQTCPKKHFKCMLDQNSSEIANDLNKRAKEG